MRRKQSMAMAALLTLVGTGAARADWLDRAWDEDSARKHGHPAVSIAGDTVHIVLPAALLEQAYEEGLTTGQALAGFLDRYGQRCSHLIDLGVPHHRLKTTLSLEGPAAFEALARQDRAALRADAASPEDRSGDRIPLLFTVQPATFR